MACFGALYLARQLLVRTLGGKAAGGGGVEGRIGNLVHSRARATRGLRRMKREQPGALFARRTRTVRRCSFDAHSKAQPRPLPPRET